MGDDIVNKMVNIMEKETGPLAAFIVRKECSKLGKKPGDITKNDIPALTELLTEALSNFDPLVAKKLHDQFLKMN